MTETISPAPVTVQMRSEWNSGSATMHVTISLGAANLDEALTLVKRATDGAPLFRNPHEEGQS